MQELLTFVKKYNRQTIYFFRNMTRIFRLWKDEIRSNNQLESINIQLNHGGPESFALQKNRIVYLRLYKCKRFENSSVKCAFFA